MDNEPEEIHYKEEKGLQDKDTTTLSDGCKTPYLFEIEEKEVEVLSEYLPKQLSEEDTKKLCN